MLKLLRKYGEATTIVFPVYDPDGINTNNSWSPANSDCSIIKDEGDPGYVTATAQLEGFAYSLALSATEMQAGRIVIAVDAVGVLDTCILIETYGHANAQFPTDLAVVTSDVAAIKSSTDNLPADPAGVSDLPVAPDNAKIANIEAELLINVTPAVNSIDSKATGIKTQTDKLAFSGSDVLATLDSEAVRLAADGWDSLAITEPSGDPSGWTVPQKLMWLIMRFMNKHSSDNLDGIKVYKADDTLATTQAVSEAAEVKTVAKVS